MTDGATGWAKQAAVLNKAQKWVFEALVDLCKRLPFAIRGLDSDNGSAFINHHMVAYCNEQRITFTRSRPWRKNDSCYVEQKNWSVVRRHVGYARYETNEACRLLNELYLVLHDYNNFFMPSMKLKEKIRNGAKVKKYYDTPRTPYMRLLESNKVSKTIKEQLKRHYAQLNPAELKRQIEKLQETDCPPRRAQPQKAVGCMNGFTTFMPIRCTQKTGTPLALPHIVSAPESALGSHPCVALSSRSGQLHFAQN